MSLWAGKVSEGKPLLVEGEAPFPLHLTRAALAGTRGKLDKAQATILSLTLGGESYVLGTFRPGQVEQMELALTVHSDSGKSYYLNIEGPGEVHVVGEIMLEGDMDDMSDDDMDYPFGSGSDDEEIPSDEFGSDDGKKGIQIEEVSEEDAMEQDTKQQPAKKPLPQQPKKAEAPKAQAQAQAQAKKPQEPKKPQQPVAAQAEKGKKRPAEGAAATASPAQKKPKTEGGAALKCPKCERTFPAEKGLQQHLKDKHKAA